ncbi:MAG TPA: hypothetical protein VGM06_06225 [Polyangiaceae bacterium]
MARRKQIGAVFARALGLAALAALGGCAFLVSTQAKAGPGSHIPCADACGNDVQCQAGCVDAPPATGYVH